LGQIGELLRDRWAERTGQRKPKWTADRAKKCRARLNEGYGHEELLRAIDGLASSEWHRNAGQLKFDLVLSSAKRVDDYLQKADEAERQNAKDVVYEAAMNALEGGWAEAQKEMGL